MIAFASRRAGARLLAVVALASLTTAGCDRMRTMFAAGEPAAGQPSALDDNNGGQRAGVVDPDARNSGSDGSGDPVPQRGERSIEFPVVPQSVTESLFPGEGAEKFAGASVPVLAPTGLSAEQAEAFVNAFRSTPDGYFARLRLDDFDVVINGTRIYAVAPESAGARSRDITELMVSESETGMSATFSRFGADYSVEFACRGAGDEAGASCVSRAEATEFVERLIPVGGGG